jgi:hypothetical protein
MNALALRNVGSVEIAIDPKAVETRDEAIENAALIVAVSNQQQATIGADALRGLRAVSKAVETSRITAKAPVLELGKRIDAAAKTFTLSVDHEVARITALLTAYEVERIRIAAEAQLKRFEEERRRLAEETARMAEITRQVQAAERAERQALNERDREAAEERRMVAEEAAAAERAAVAERQANLPVVAERPKVAGTVVREEWNFEVTDLRAFAQAHPDLVEITVKRAAVLQKIRGGVRQLAHTRIYEETKVGVRV